MFSFLFRNIIDCIIPDSKKTFLTQKVLTVTAGYMTHTCVSSFGYTNTGSIHPSITHNTYRFSIIILHVKIHFLLL